MTELRPTYIYEKYTDFMMRGIRLTEEVMFIPYFISSKSKNVFCLLRINKNGYLTDLGDKYPTNNITEYVEKCFRDNTIGSIDIKSHESILENLYISFSTVYNVETGSMMINKTCQPILYLRMEVSSMQILKQIVTEFKLRYQISLKGGFSTYQGDTQNLVWINPSDLYYLCRGTTYRVKTDDGSDLIVNIEDNGFPAEKTVTSMYRANRENGEIPYNFVNAESANTCPEVVFYEKTSYLLKNSMVEYFENNETIFT